MYFLGLSLRNKSNALTIFKDQKEAMYKFRTELRDLVHIIYTKGKKSIPFIIDETPIQIASNTFGYGSVSNLFTNLYLEARFQEKQFLLKNLLVHLNKYGKYLLYTDGNTW